MSTLTIRADIDLNGLDNMLKAAGDRAPMAISRALNRTGVPVANAMKRTIRKTLGLRNHPYAKKPLGDALKRSTSVRKATRGNLEFSLAGFGKGLPLIYYQPKEAPVGASFNWLGARKTIERTFYLSGKFPGRRRSGISEAVRERRKPGRWKLYQPKGPSVPDAMRTPAAGAAWQAEANRRLPHHLGEALRQLLEGRFAR